MKKLLMILLLTVPGWCVLHSLVLTGQTQSLTVQAGDNVEFVGDSNQVTVVGDCDGITVTGSNNQLRLDGQVNSLEVVGSGNQVSWVERPGRRAPSFESLGTNNQILAVKP